jgi:hypothetical protein
MLRADVFAEGACYTDLRTRKWVAMTILQSCYRIGAGASLFRKLDELAALDFSTMDDDDRIRLHVLLGSLDPPILDAVRIATFFENLFKVCLLLRGYVIHRIEKETVNPSYQCLAKAQQKRPITISEIKRTEGLIGRQQPDYEFQSLSSFTLEWSTMVTKRAYRTQLCLPPDLFSSLKDIAAKRNSLHYLADAAAVYNHKFIEDLLFIRQSFNRFIVRAHNDLVQELKLSGIHPLQEI